MKITQFFLLVLYYTMSHSQVNCYIYPEGSGERKACELSYKAIEHPQGSKESQMIFDEAIALGPKFDWAYYEKSVPYFKRGFLHAGLQLLNKAIELQPEQYLWYRAYWHWQYRNYKLCIEDLEHYYKLPRAFKQQTTPGGEKDMHIILGLAYAKRNNFKKGIKVIEDCIKNYESESDIGLADYHALGTLYLKDEQYQNAIEAFEKQLKLYKLAESHYFIGLAYKKLNNINDAKAHFKIALDMFENTNHRHVPNAGYHVYTSDILKELNKL